MRLTGPRILLLILFAAFCGCLLLPGCTWKGTMGSELHLDEPTVTASAALKDGAS